ncbi:hypothetical protein FOZ62_000834 [Perkinsus olseni]|uniref:DUF2817 domain-containing protein n=1 Tax=Perkinsus olseni TaxID=32597 RepID=A0A7J6SB08_PEROL|nr:hypothetical protein FOZ62_000834 [Perkinsus olseni]
MDVAILRPTEGPTSGSVVHTSGVHGVEGYAGSGIQCYILDQIRRSREEGRLAGIGKTLVLVHAVNPYGMVHYRRFNEENVDLNRNALEPQEFDYLVNERDPNVAGYVDLDAILNPREMTMPSLLYNAVILLARYGISRVKRAVVSAQYWKPSGLFYGGQKLQRSHQILTQVFADLKIFEENATIIDIHTGLGPSGVDTLITSDSDAFDFFSTLVKSRGPSDAPPVECVGADCSAAVGERGQSGFGADVVRGYDIVRGDASSFWTRKRQASTSDTFHGIFLPGVVSVTTALE